MSCDLKKVLYDLFLDQKCSNDDDVSQRSNKLILKKQREWNDVEEMTKI